MHPYRLVGQLKRYRLLRHEHKHRLTGPKRRDKGTHGPTRRGALIVVLACEGVVPRDPYSGSRQRLEVNADGTALGQKGGVRQTICGYAQDHTILIALGLVRNQLMAGLERPPLIQAWG